MSRKLIIRRSLGCSADRLLRIISTAEFLTARHHAQGAVEVTFVELCRSESRLIQQVTVREPAHTMRGIDPEKLESSTTTYEWDFLSRVGHWNYSGPHGSLLELTGNSRIEPQGDGCTFSAEFEVSAKLPLIGGIIEKRVIKAIEAGQPAVDALVEEYLRH